MVSSLGLGLGLGIRFKVPASEWTVLRTPITCQGNASEGLSMHAARNQMVSSSQNTLKNSTTCPSSKVPLYRGISYHGVDQPVFYDY